MIDISAAKPSSIKFNVVPSDNIFEELGNNTYNFTDLISELIDNSIAARFDDYLLEVNLSVGLSDHKDRTFFVITDNAAGIDRTKLGQAISPAASQHADSLNEHGLGMKQAVASLGKLEYLVTKTREDKEAVAIDEFKYGQSAPRTIDVPWSSGTEIKVSNLRAIVPRNQAHYSRGVVKYLGARYRRFLLPDAAQMKLTLQLLDADSDTLDTFTTYKIEPIKPVYFHPNTRDNKPVIERKKFTGKGWTAELTFGYAPQDKEYAALGLEKPTKFDPYHVSNKNQGLDIILHDRIIQFHMLSEIELVQARHNDFNFIRGEIDLQKGFSTAITKNMILEDEHFVECKDQIKTYLDQHDYLKRKTYPEDLPEELLRRRLANWLSTNKLSPRKDVKMEYAVQALGGSIDILADDEAWELKREEANGIDVYQLFAYLDMGNISRGFLAAKSFSTGAHAAADHLKQKHQKEIVLTKLEEFPILHPMTDEERSQYA